ncbi:ETS-related transcription factor Elf-4-like isoform X2 [Palaemon carinicauda]|uniref:ETS-related transcription factor Elf-4-like isoform X2 n=1 Tax=Palaemon carinicauda TaxID=392227 RepID=UPI0035B5D961
MEELPSFSVGNSVSHSQDILCWPEIYGATGIQSSLNSSALIAQNDPFLWCEDVLQPLATSEYGAVEVERMVESSPFPDHLHNPQWFTTIECFHPQDSVSTSGDSMFTHSEVSEICGSAGSDGQSSTSTFSEMDDFDCDSKTGQLDSLAHQTRRITRSSSRIESKQSVILSTENDTLEERSFQYFSPVSAGFDPLTRVQSNTRSRDRGPKSWEFLVRLLMDSSSNPRLICWENQDRFTFRIKKPKLIAEMWGRRINKHISYESFARGLRYHYGKGGLVDIPERKLVYGLGEKAIDFLFKQYSGKPKTVEDHMQ